MSWLFKQNTPEKLKHKKQMSDQGFYTEPQVMLPPNFADELLNLELEIEQPNVSIETVVQLVELYRIAIEYYSSIKSDKYMVFKNKSQSLLLRPNISQVLNQDSKPPDKIENSSFNSALQKQKEIRNSLSYLQQLDSTEQVQKFLQTEMSTQQQMSNIIENDIKSQEDRLNQRMMRRRKDPQMQPNFFMNKSQSSGQMGLSKRKDRIGQRSAEQLDQVDFTSKQKSSGSDLLGIEEEDKEITPDIGNMKKDQFTFDKTDSQTKQLRQFCKTETDDQDDAIDTEQMKLFFQKSNNKAERDPDLQNLIQLPQQNLEELPLGDLEVNGNGNEKMNVLVSFNNVSETDGISQDVQVSEQQNEQDFSIDNSKTSEKQENKTEIADEKEKTSETTQPIKQNQNSEALKEEERDYVLQKVQKWMEEQEQATKQQEAARQKKQENENTPKNKNEPPTFLQRAKTFQSLFSSLNFSKSNNESPKKEQPTQDSSKREKKIRDMVANNKVLAQQKQDLLKNQMLPF